MKASFLKSAMSGALFVLLVSFCPGLPAQESFCLTEENNHLGKQLLGSGKLIVLAKEAAASKPSNTKEAFFKISVLLRAGMEKESCEALRELKKLSPEIRSYDVVDIYKQAVALKTWGCAQECLELFADSCDENIMWFNLPFTEILVHFAASGWTPEKIDAWLAARPPGKDSFWLKQRFSFRREHDQKALFEEISAKIKKNPEDISTALGLVDALDKYGDSKLKSDCDLDWLPETIKPKLASDAAAIASALKQMQRWNLAAHYYKISIGIPLTDGELDRLYNNMQRTFGFGTGKRDFFLVEIREGLAECLVKMGQADEAQKYLVEAGEIRKKSGQEMNDSLAGELGPALKFDLGEKLKAMEKDSASDPKYWLRRFEHNRFKKNLADQEYCLIKGLAVAEPVESHRGKGGWGDSRSKLLSHYFFFLGENKRNDEALALAKKELKESPPISGSSAVAVGFLISNPRYNLDIDNPLFWNWLSKRKEWDMEEGPLLMAILKKADTQRRDEIISKIEGMISENDISRKFAFASALEYVSLSARAIPLFEYVMENAEKNHGIKGAAAGHLYSIYLKKGDIPNAEKYAILAGDGTPSRYEIESLLDCALKVKNKPKILEYWTLLANFEPTNYSRFEEFAEAGLKKEMVAFYSQMKAELPNSLIPDTALAKLASLKD